MAIITNLQAGLTRKEVAAAVGCDIQTVDRVKGKLKKNPELMETLYKRCGAKIDELVPAAIERLERLINDDLQQGSVHVAAAREILNRSRIDEMQGVTDKPLEIVVKHV